jgi:topoisomerase-4 subunit B
VAKKPVAYDENAIKTLDPLAHIRLRTGMYIGRLGDGSSPEDGIYVMLKEVVDNSVDEFIMGEGKRIEIERDGTSITVRDFGRGIPLGKVVDCVSKINTGGKYNDDVFQFSVGLNGVGTKAVNALSSEFEVCSWRDGRFRWAKFAQGKILKDEEGKDDKTPRGTMVRFVPDPEIFGTYTWGEETIAARLRYYAHLHAGLTLVYNGQTFKSKDGLKDLIAGELGEARQEYETAHARLDKLEIAFTHTNTYGENVLSFVNGQHTKDGGTHLTAFREGLVKGVNEFAKASFAGEDVRDGLLAAVAVKIQDPVFESQTKNKLGSADVRPWIVQETRNAVVVWLHKHPEAGAKLLEKVRANERLRKELSAIKKDVRERERATALRIPKLTDCRTHLNDGSEDGRERSTIFLTEGDSAGGGMVQARDVDTQAIFCLRGKPPNVHGLQRDAVYKNEELYNIMRALGIENGLDGLRYQRVVIATDADVDGMHIRNLLLTYFLRYFEELVTSGHLFILETPLFRVRNKEETRYCYTEAERDAAVRALKSPETTRFKGLGEISPKEFEQFIGESMRLVPVVTRNVGEVDRCLEFFMGKNTPDRRAFIEKHLIPDVV